MSDPTRTTQVSREETERELDWRPPQQLETPTPPPGYKFRWVRFEIRGQDDVKNVVSRLRQHYEIVQLDDLQPHDREIYIKMDHSRWGGAVVAGDCILTQVPERVAAQRQKAMDDRAGRLQQSVDDELARQAHPSMPFDGDRKSTYTVGRDSREKFQDE